MCGQGCIFGRASVNMPVIDSFPSYGVEPSEENRLLLSLLFCDILGHTKIVMYRTNTNISQYN